MAHKREAELIEKTLQGRAEAFDELVCLYQDKVYNLIYRLCHHHQDAQDLTQEVFIKAYESLPDFQFKSNFYTWLYRIAANLFFSRERHAKARTVIKTIPIQVSAGDRPTERSGELPPAPGADPGDLAQGRETLEMIQQAIDSLDDGQRMVVLLRHVEGLEYLQIAEILQWPVGTVKSSLHRARLELREKLKHLEDSK